MSKERDVWLRQQHEEAKAFMAKKLEAGWSTQRIQQALNDKNRARESAGDYGPA